MIGRTQEMKLAIQVKNLGEDSFESLVKVQLPEGVSYINVLKVKSVSPINSLLYLYTLDGPDHWGGMLTMVKKYINPKLQKSIYNNNDSRPNTIKENYSKYE